MGHFFGILVTGAVIFFGGMLFPPIWLLFFVLFFSAVS
jgi:hypothetical protein